MLNEQTPYDLGMAAAKNKQSVHSNPFKSPNMPKTDDVKSDAWLLGYDNYIHYGDLN